MSRRRRLLGGGLTIRSGNVLWLDASDTSTITESSGSVSAWADKSGQGNNVTQGTGSAQPTTGATTQNGLNIIDFDGGDLLNIPVALRSITEGDSTIFIVSKRASEDATTDGILGFLVSGNAFLGFQFQGTPGRIEYRHSSGGFLSNNGNINTNMNVIRGRRNGTTQAISINNGAEVSSEGAESSSSIDNARIGFASTGVSLAGSIAEILVYDRSLSAAEMTQVNNYLTNKWLGFQVPTDIGNLQLWLDASDTSTITEVGGSVSQWDDKSGNGNDVTQGTGSLQPKTGASTQNGKNILDFDGGDILNVPSALYSLTEGASTIFIVAKRASEDATTDGILGFNIAGNAFIDIQFDGTAGRIEYRHGVSTFCQVNGNTNTNMNVIRTTRSDTTQTLSINNGTADSNTAATSSSSIDAARFGASSLGIALSGSIAEILIYNRSLSVAEMTAVNNYLSDKWLGFQIPTDIGNCQLWLDASDTSTITEVAGSVSQWDDKSGNGNDVTQGTGSAQPTTGVTTQNGRNVLDFATDDFLSAPSALYTLPNGNSTVFIVSKGEATSQQRVISATESGSFRYGVEYTSGGNVLFQNNTSASGGVSSAIEETQFNLISAYRSDTTQGISVNGAAFTTNTSANSEDGVTALAIGANAGGSVELNGSIAEIIIYDRFLSASEIANVQNYLSRKWGI